MSFVSVRELKNVKCVDGWQGDSEVCRFIGV